MEPTGRPSSSTAIAMQRISAVSSVYGSASNHTIIVCLDTAPRSRHTSSRVGDQIVACLCPDIANDHLVCRKLNGNRCFRVLAILKQGDIVSRHRLGRWTIAIRQDVNEVACCRQKPECRTSLRKRRPGDGE